MTIGKSEFLIRVIQVIRLGLMRIVENNKTYVMSPACLYNAIVSNSDNFYYLKTYNPFTLMKNCNDSLAALSENEPWANAQNMLKDPTGFIIKCAHKGVLKVLEELKCLSPNLEGGYQTKEFDKDDFIMIMNEIDWICSF